MHYENRITVMITRHHCFVINVKLSYSVDVFANLTSMFTTRFVALRFIISNSIRQKSDEGREVVSKRILEAEQRYLQSFYHLLKCGNLI